MAAPAVSGAALLIRQYLSDSSTFVDHLRAVSTDLAWPNCLPGFPPGCEPAAGLDTQGLTLTNGAGGALVKAMIIHSTIAMVAWDTEFYPNAPSDVGKTATLVSLSSSAGGDGPPDNYQGFGRVDLSTVLLPSTSTPGNGNDGLSLWCSDALSISSGAPAREFTFHVVSSSKPFKATLVGGLSMSLLLLFLSLSLLYSIILSLPSDLFLLIGLDIDIRCGTTPPTASVPQNSFSTIWTSKCRTGPAGSGGSGTAPFLPPKPTT